MASMPTSTESPTESTKDQGTASASSPATQTVDFTEPEYVDTTSVLGLRGWLVLYYVLSTALLDDGVNLLGGLSMPLIFLSSGFAFALMDGRTRWAPLKCCSELGPVYRDPEATETSLPRMDARRFYWRRFTRTAPAYWLTSVLGLPLIWAGHGWFGQHKLLIFVYSFDFTATATWPGYDWLGGTFSYQLDPPAWFVSTLWFFYWIYPSLLPHLQALAAPSKEAWLPRLFLVQLVLMAALHRTLYQFNPYAAFTVAVYWPVARFPLFVMGLLAGLLRVSSQREHRTHLPLGGLAWLCGLLPARSDADRSSSGWWARVVDLELALLVGVMAAAVVATNVLLPKDVTKIWPAAVYLQAALPCSHLTLLVALSLADPAASTVIRLLRTRMSQWLGTLSFSLFLMHSLVLEYTSLAINGPAARPMCGSFGLGCPHPSCGDPECEAEWNAFFEARKVPLWALTFVLPLMLLAASVLHYAVERPARVLLDQLYGKALESQYTKIKQDDLPGIHAPTAPKVPPFPRYGAMYNKGDDTDAGQRI